MPQQQEGREKKILRELAGRRHRRVKIQSARARRDHESAAARNVAGRRSIWLASSRRARVRFRSRFRLEARRRLTSSLSPRFRSPFAARRSPTAALHALATASRCSDEYWRLTVFDASFWTVGFANDWREDRERRASCRRRDARRRRLCRHDFAAAAAFRPLRSRQKPKADDDGNVEKTRICANVNRALDEYRVRRFSWLPPQRSASGGDEAPTLSSDTNDRNSRLGSVQKQTSCTRHDKDYESSDHARITIVAAAAAAAVRATKRRRRRRARARI